MGNMELKKVKITDIKPYAGNPRKNKAAVNAVAESIKQCDYIAPIIVDENMEVLAGHTRLKALKKLGRKNAEIVIKAGLTEEQKRKYRLLDNKTNELADWDIPQLAIELEGLDFEGLDLDWGIPDLDDAEEEDDGYFGDERERTYNSYNLQEFDPDNVEGFYQMPILEPCYAEPDDIISFNYMLTATNFDVGIHFYCDDYQFERLWNTPYRYINHLADFQCAFTPDFSLYLDMPMSMKIWNVYRSRLIGQIMQREGLEVIPTVSWAEPDTFEFCFDGLPRHATLSTSTIGVKQDPDAMAIWKAGMDEMIKRLEPLKILVYGGTVEYDYQGIEVRYYENITTKRMSEAE